MLFTTAALFFLGLVLVVAVADWLMSKSTWAVFIIAVAIIVIGLTIEGCLRPWN